MQLNPSRAVLAQQGCRNLAKRRAWAQLSEHGAGIGVDPRPADDHTLVIGECLHQESDDRLVYNAVNDGETAAALAPGEGRIGLVLETELGRRDLGETAVGHTLTEEDEPTIGFEHRLCDFKKSETAAAGPA